MVTDQSGRLEAGATIAEACRAVEISRPTVYRRVRGDAAFASPLDLARAHRSGPPVGDWRAAAAILESNFPERWSLPGDLGDPFDAFTSTAARRSAGEISAT